METAIPFLTIGLLTLNVILLLVLIKASKGRDGTASEHSVRDELRAGRTEAGEAARNLREEVSGGLKSVADTITRTIGEMGSLQKAQLDAVNQQIKDLTDTNQSRIEALRSTVDGQLKQIQESNEKKLDEMRKTVDEKLHDTLEKRLGESFKLVSDRLEAVAKGLGEMQSLAIGVGDLKRVLMNVKTRGTWGEIQLGSLLEQILTPEQYDVNVQTNEHSQERVEFAVRLPGLDGRMGSPVWLPIDAKFPQEDYLRLLDASDAGDADSTKRSTADLARAIRACANDINTKYLNPPHTTDFAVMFLPIEGLYAEVLRQSGLVEELQQKYRVVVAGPTTLAALLSSLRMGFRTLAIEQRASEVWKVLAAVKAEFSKFGEVLAKVKKQLDTAGRTIESTGARTRAMERKLREVEELPLTEAQDLLGLNAELLMSDEEEEVAANESDDN